MVWFFGEFVGTIFCWLSGKFFIEEIIFLFFFLDLIFECDWYFLLFCLGGRLFDKGIILLGFVLIWIVFCKIIIGFCVREYCVFLLFIIEFCLLFLFKFWVVIEWFWGGLFFELITFVFELFFLLFVFLELLWMFIRVGCFLLMVGFELFVEEFFRVGKLV